MHPGRYTVRLTVDGAVNERAIAVRMDPRVPMNAEEIQLQTDNSMACYDAYLEAQFIREAIDAALVDPRRTLAPAAREKWVALRGSGAPGDPDTLYGSIRATPANEETVVDLQEKLLFLLKIFQEADARPTPQAIDAVARLRENLQALKQRWGALQ